MARIYTRTGDQGQTFLADGSPISKAGPRVELYGEVDELNSQLGLCVALMEGQPKGCVAGLAEGLLDIQHRLFDLGAVLADPGRCVELADLPLAKQPFSAMALEQFIDQFTGPLPALTAFILPGGHPIAAQLHVARAVCRRIERQAVSLSETGAVPAGALVWLNRLSDFLFTAARAVNHARGEGDVLWREGS